MRKFYLNSLSKNCCSCMNWVPVYPIVREITLLKNVQKHKILESIWECTNGLLSIQNHEKLVVKMVCLLMLRLHHNSSAWIKIMNYNNTIKSVLYIL